MEEKQEVVATTNSKNELSSDNLKKIKQLLEHKEISPWLSTLREVFAFNKKWADLIETVITLIVAGFLVLILIWLVDHSYLDKSSFGVMFGTVFGYLLSWRFGK